MKIQKLEFQKHYHSEKTTLILIEQDAAIIFNNNGDNYFDVQNYLIKLKVKHVNIYLNENNVFGCLEFFNYLMNTKFLGQNNYEIIISTNEIKCDKIILDFNTTKLNREIKTSSVNVAS